MSLAQPLQIGDVRLRNRVVLAPMAGLSDAVMRWLAWQFGAGLTVGEMVSSRSDLWHSHKSEVRRKSFAGSGPRVVQIAGTEPPAMAEIARRHVDEGAQLIDINFGCPAKKVCRKAAGSALMEQPQLIGRIVAAVSGAVDVPVSIKMRTGPHPDRRNGAEVARVAEDSGARSIAVHGRTRADRFLGEAEYDTIRQIKAAVSVPVFANGDITSRAQAERVMRLTGADGVLVGRAAVGQPWLLGTIAGRDVPDLHDRWQALRWHVEHTHELYGPARGLRTVRKHVAEYLRGFGLGGDVAAFNALQDATHQLQFLDDLGSQALSADQGGRKVA